MICPHCNHSNDHERFFSSGLKLNRTYNDNGYEETERAELFACPECNKTFIDWKD
jgi:hypothetical protein